MNVRVSVVVPVTSMVFTSAVTSFLVVTVRPSGKVSVAVTVMGVSVIDIVEAGTVTVLVKYSLCPLTVTVLVSTLVVTESGIVSVSTICEPSLDVIVLLIV